MTQQGHTKKGQIWASGERVLMSDWVSCGWEGLRLVTDDTCCGGTWFTIWESGTDGEPGSFRRTQNKRPKRSSLWQAHFVSKETKSVDSTVQRDGCESNSDIGLTCCPGYYWGQVIILSLLNGLVASETRASVCVTAVQTVVMKTSQTSSVPLWKISVTLSGRDCSNGTIWTSPFSGGLEGLVAHQALSGWGEPRECGD